MCAQNWHKIDTAVPPPFLPGRQAWRSFANFWPLRASVDHAASPHHAPNRQHERTLRIEKTSAACRRYGAAGDTGARCKTRAPPSPASARASVARAKAAITYQLKDPDSVRWRGAAVDDYGNVCIEVNAKNSYGGYTGFEAAHYNGTYGSVAFNDGASGACLAMKWRGKFIRMTGQ